MNRTSQGIVILAAGLLFIAVVIRAAGHIDLKKYTTPQVESIAEKYLSNKLMANQ